MFGGSEKLGNRGGKAGVSRSPGGVSAYDPFDHLHSRSRMSVQVDSEQVQEEHTGHNRCSAKR
jgi:hypothetical protein